MPSPSYRLAMIGTRGHQKYVLDRLPAMPNVEFVAAARGGDSIDGYVKWAAEHGRSIEQYGDDWVEMLDRVRPDILVVCGPFELHARMCIAAIDRGIHVLTEKTAAITDEDLAALEEACNRNPQVHLADMMASRYDDGFFAAWSLIQRGGIGRVRLINARKSYRLGKRAAFYSDRSTYGGTIPWVGSHAIDWALWFAGAAKPRTVYATHSARDNGGNGTMERSAACLITFDDEVAATVSIDVFRPETAPSHGDDWARVVGTTGVLECREHALDVVGGDRSMIPAPLAPSGRDLFGDFIDHISGKRPALIDRHSTLALTRICLAARRSADERRVIEL